MEFLGFSIDSIVLSAYDSFTSFLPIWTTLISLSCLTAVTFHMLNRSHESGHPCSLNLVKRLSTFHH